jgi:hypothetical protein
MQTRGAAPNARRCYEFAQEKTGNTNWRSGGRPQKKRPKKTLALGHSRNQGAGATPRKPLTSRLKKPSHFGKTLALV